MSTETKSLMDLKLGNQQASLSVHLALSVIPGKICSRMGRLQEENVALNHKWNPGLLVHVLK